MHSYLENLDHLTVYRGVVPCFFGPKPLDGEDPKPLSPEEIRKIAEEAVNAAVNGLDKRLRGTFDKQLGEIKEAIGKLATEPKGDGGDPPDPAGKDKDKGGDPALRARLADLERSNSTMAKTLERVNSELETTKREKAESDITAKITAALGDKPWANPASMQMALAEIRKAVKLEDGQLLAQTEKGPLTLDAFITQFLDQAPNLLKASTSGGSGGPTGKPGKTSFDPGQPINDQNISDAMKALQQLQG